MKRYKVHASWECQGYYYVDAEDEEEALDIVDHIYEYPKEYNEIEFRATYAEEIK